MSSPQEYQLIIGIPASLQHLTYLVRAVRGIRLILVAGGKSDVYLTEIINESISEQYYKEQWNILELIRLLVAITFSI